MNETNNINELEKTIAKCVKDCPIIHIYMLPYLINTINKAVFLSKNDVDNDLSEA